MTFTKQESKKIRSINTRTITDLKNNLLQEDWKYIMQEQNPLRQFKMFHSLFLYHLDICTPLKKIPQKKNVQTIWTPELRQIRETLGLILDVYNNTNDHEILPILKHYKQFYLDACLQNRQCRNMNKLENSENKSKTIWTIINHETGKTKYQPSHQDSPDANELNNYFTTFALKTVGEIKKQPVSAAEFVRNVRVNGNSIQLLQKILISMYAG